MLTAGVARRTINPQLNVPHGGWGAQTHVFAEGYEADLYTTALYLGEEDEGVLIVDVDAGFFLVEQANRIREQIAQETGLATERIRLSVTHTHAGPCFPSNYYAEGREANLAYVQMLTEQTVAAAAEAIAGRRHVHAEAGRGFCAIGKNRRQRLESGVVATGWDESGVADPEVGTVRFVAAEDGQTIASLVHYSCHPTTLGYTCKVHSPDYPGVLKRTVERIVGGTCLFLQGSAGNVGPGPEGFLDNTAAMRRIGTALGAEAISAMMRAEAETKAHRFERIVESGARLAIWHTEIVRGDQTFRFGHTTVPLPLIAMPDPGETLARYESLQRELARLQQAGAGEEAIRQVTFQLKRTFLSWEMAVKYEGKTHARIDAQIVRIGDTALIGCPLEPFAEIGLRIKELSPFGMTLFSGYSNGHYGYLPTAEAYTEGGYEVETSPFRPEAADTLVRHMADYLRQFYREGNSAAWTTSSLKRREVD